MAFVFKVFTLTVRTVAKPLAGRFEQYILTHPSYRPKVVGLAQTVHRLEVLVNRAFEGRTGRAFVGQLSEEKALQNAGKLASEAFIMTVGIGVIAWEYERQARKEQDKKVKEADLQAELRRRRNQELLRIADVNEQQNAMLASIMHRVQHLEEHLGIGKPA